jgi:DOPA 4,5-dioxygenase
MNIVFTHPGPSIGLGYSSTAPEFTLDERLKLGAEVEQILKGEKEAARAPVDV